MRGGGAGAGPAGMEHNAESIWLREVVGGSAVCYRLASLGTLYTLSTSNRPVCAWQAAEALGSRGYPH